MMFAMEVDALGESLRSSIDVQSATVPACAAESTQDIENNIQQHEGTGAHRCPSRICGHARPISLPQLQQDQLMALQKVMPVPWADSVAHTFSDIFFSCTSCFCVLQAPFLMLTIVGT